MPAIKPATARTPISASCGDGSMKAAHALYHISQQQSQDRARGPLSVVAIPKTMDNDVLWVWQSFGFLSAVEKAREVIGI